MSLGLTLVLERIQWHKEIANHGHNSVQLSSPSRTESEVQNSLNSTIRQRRPIPRCQQVFLFLAVILISLVLGTLRLIFADHALNQVIFGWLLGIWIALTFFYILREPVHTHIEDLTNGRLNSSPKVYYLISVSIWLFGLLAVFIAYLSVHNQKIFKLDDQG